MDSAAISMPEVGGEGEEGGEEERRVSEQAQPSKRGRTSKTFPEELLPALVMPLAGECPHLAG